MTEQRLARAAEALRRSAVPLRGLRPRLGFDDLRPLAAIIGEARVVGLGEAAHGAGELFTVKHRLIEYLVVELGFTGVAFEASYAGCQPIDEYVRHGRGVAAEALTGQGYTAWDTDEVSALLEWLRLHNSGVPHDRKVAFYGLDSGYNAVGRHAVLDLVARAAPSHFSAAREVLSSLETLERKWPFRFGNGPSGSIGRALIAAESGTNGMAHSLDCAADPSCLGTARRPKPQTVDHARPFELALLASEQDRC